MRARSRMPACCARRGGLDAGLVMGEESRAPWPPRLSAPAVRRQLELTEPVKTRIEKDTFGPIEVPADRLWGAQTQRSLQHFKISERADAARRSSTRWPW